MKYILIIAVVAFLSGCASTKPIDIAITEVDAPTVSAPIIRPMKLRGVEWIVIEYEGKAIFGLTAEEYEDLSLNMEEIIRFIEQQKALIEFLKNARK